MKTDSYQKLAQHLDRLPGGFPPSDSGAEWRLLKRLFKPDEAELAIHLTLDREEARVIAGRAGLDLAKAEPRLKEMARQGLIFSIEPEGGPILYQAVPWIVGIYVRNGLGRFIDQAEAMEILTEADQANLVLQPSNSRDVTFMCCCCGCCCALLTRLKLHPKPSEQVASPFIAKAELETCEGCGVCADRCQMEAVTLGDGRVVLNSARCLGCGLCVSTCPTGSLTLARKPAQEHIKVPITMDDTWRELSQVWKNRA